MRIIKYCIEEILLVPDDVSDEEVDKHIKERAEGNEYHWNNISNLEQKLCYCYNKK